jgi:hypothetical protein
MTPYSLPPQAHTLISATRHIGYSLEAAVADLIDNSIAAGAKTIDIFFDDVVANPYIAILDDGSGMDDVELTNAMQYGSADPNKARSENDLGRYGLGLKTASMSQCKTMTVVSKKETTSARRWDLDYIEKHKDLVWPLLMLDNEEWQDLPCVENLVKMKTGTLVLWNKIDFGGAYDETTFDDAMYKMTEHLSLVFHRYLHGEVDIRKIKIRVNGNALKAKDPFLQYCSGEKHGHQCKATQPLGVGKNRIMLQAFTLPHNKELTDKMRESLGTERQLKRTQGFYIYRNKRLITYGSWFGLKAQGEFFKLARVKVDIPNSLDMKWSLDVKKSIAIPPKQVVSGLRAYVDSVVKQSKNAIRVEVFGRKVKSDDDVQVWNATTNDGVVTSVEINRRHPVIQSVIESKVVSEKLLQLLERTLPIDVIYYSRSGEQKLTNEVPLSLAELLEMLKGFINMIPPGVARKSAFQTMLMSEPFVMHADMLRAHEKEVLNATI